MSEYSSKAKFIIESGLNSLYSGESEEEAQEKQRVLRVQINLLIQLGIISQEESLGYLQRIQEIGEHNRDSICRMSNEMNKELSISEWQNHIDHIRQKERTEREKAEPSKEESIKKGEDSLC